MPSWKIEVIVYLYTDLTYQDAVSSHRLVGSLVPDEVANIKNSSAGFVNSDIPALTSGTEHPTLRVKSVSRPLDSQTLTADNFGGFTPAPWTTTADQDPGYDSYIVFWQSFGWDWGPMKSDNIAHAGGLTWGRGTSPTFSAIQMPELAYAGRNVLKHEWGHAITFYYDARGTAPKPMVDNHQPDTSVNCHTHNGYLHIDETASNPVPNSIYNNGSGFTHDYYSGVTAQASNPSHCIGITPAAWLSGGPVTKR